MNNINKCINDKFRILFNIQYIRNLILLVKINKKIYICIFLLTYKILKYKYEDFQNVSRFKF